MRKATKRRSDGATKPGIVWSLARRADKWLAGQRASWAALAAGSQRRKTTQLKWPSRDQVSFTTRRSITELTPSGMLGIFSAADQFLADQIVLAYEMEESDPDLAGTLRVRRAAVRRLAKNVQPGDPDDQRSVRAADELDTLVQQGWWGKLEDWLLHAIWHQHAAAELSYDANWMPTGYRAVEPERYYVDDDLSVAMYRDLAAPSSGDLARFEPGSFIHHTHQAVAGQPGRYATVRTLAKLWYLAHLNLTGWGKLIDRWGQPFTHFEYDAATMSEVELRSLVDTYLGLADEMVVATPQGVQVNLQEPIEHTPNREFAEFYAKCVSRFLLGQETAQHATAGQETGATVQGQVRDDLRDDDAEALDDTLATQFIAPWCAWVFGPTVAPPLLRHVSQTVLDQEQRARVFAAGQALGLAIRKEQVYDELGIETPAEGDELLVPPAAQSVPAAGEVDNVAFPKRILELLAQGQMTREMLVNLLDVQGIIELAGLPLYNQDKGGDAEPWLPILAPPGMAEVTGDVKRDDEGDIVGGDVQEPPPQAGGEGFGGLPFKRLAREHPNICRRVTGGWLVRPRALVQAMLGEDSRILGFKDSSRRRGARSSNPGILGSSNPPPTNPLRAAFEGRVKAVRRYVESAGGLQAVRDKLANLFAELNGGADDPLAGAVHEATFGAYAGGRLNMADRELGGAGSKDSRIQGSKRRRAGAHLESSNPRILESSILAGGQDAVERGRFAEAIDSLAQRGDLVTKDAFNQLEGLNRSRAWTVARVSDLNIIKDLHGAVGQAIEGGQSYREFVDSLNSIMEQRGWSGLEPTHAKLVYEQNVNMAHTAGRFDQAADAGVEYWRYLPSDSAVPREEHKQYYGKVFKMGEGPMPPLDFGCKCGWEPVFADEVQSGDVQRQPPSQSGQEFKYRPGDYYRPMELRQGDWPRELWPLIKSLASDANALLKLRG